MVFSQTIPLKKNLLRRQRQKSVIRGRVNQHRYGSFCRTLVTPLFVKVIPFRLRQRVFPVAVDRRHACDRGEWWATKEQQVVRRMQFPRAIGRRKPHRLRPEWRARNARATGTADAPDSIQA